MLPRRPATSAKFPSALAELGDSGTPKIQVNPIQVSEQMNHPVFLRARILMSDNGLMFRLGTMGFSSSSKTVKERRASAGYD